MSAREERIAELLSRYIEHHVVHGTRLPLDDLCEGDSWLKAELARRVAEYESLHETMATPAGARRASGAALAASEGGEPMPSWEGFRTIERIGRGGMGDVYKLEDMKLSRMVAAKVVRRDAQVGSTLQDFLREARTLALFQDPRIVSILEFRPDAEPPVIIMELVEGFPLHEIAPSLEYSQRARLLLHACEAVQHAHALGLTHRDLKPGNIMVDRLLQPRVLDFGLASSQPGSGHFVGTPRYLAPEQLDSERPIDARTDVYALGAILYEILCGSPAHDGATVDDVLASVRRGAPRLPAEIAPSVPEPLQAIALKALETEPALRYAGAREMAADLRRYLEGKPVLARPTLYATALQQRVQPHLAAIEEWLRLALLHRHEAARLSEAYRALDRREDDWIVESRSLSFSQIALYLGAFTLACAGLFYFWAHRVEEAASGTITPLIVLGVPFVALAAAALVLYRDGTHRAVSVAFHLASSALLPPLLLVLLTELAFLPLREGMKWQLLEDWSVSNRQLQVALVLSGLWAAALAWRTQTIALSSLLTLMVLLTGLAAMTDLGLIDWIDDGAWDRLALRLLPLAVVIAMLGVVGERRRLPWFSMPLYVGAAIVGMAALELLAVDGRMVARLGLSLSGFQSAEVADPVLLDTLAAMSFNGLLFYGAGWLLERRGSAPLQPASKLLLLVSPLAILEPIAWLCESEEYSRVFDWAYLALALGIAVASHFHERKSFYYVGLLNSGIALVFLARRYEWLDDLGWSEVLVLSALGLLALGLVLQVRERSRRA